MILKIKNIMNILLISLNNTGKGTTILSNIIRFFQISKYCFKNIFFGKLYFPWNTLLIQEIYHYTKVIPKFVLQKFHVLSSNISPLTFD